MSTSDAGDLVRRQAAPAVEQVEGVEAGQDPEPVGGLLRREALAEEAVLRQSPGERASCPWRVAAPSAAWRRRRRPGRAPPSRQRAEDVAVGGEGVHPAGDPVAQVHARVGIGDRVEHPAGSRRARAGRRRTRRRARPASRRSRRRSSARRRRCARSRSTLTGWAGASRSWSYTRVEHAPARLLGRLCARSRCS